MPPLHRLWVELLRRKGLGVSLLRNREESRCGSRIIAGHGRRLEGRAARGSGTQCAACASAWHADDNLRPLYRLLPSLRGGCSHRFLPSTGGIRVSPLCVRGASRSRAAPSSALYAPPVARRPSRAARRRHAVERRPASAGRRAPRAVLRPSATIHLASQSGRTAESTSAAPRVLISAPRRCARRARCAGMEPQAHRGGQRAADARTAESQREQDASRGRPSRRSVRLAAWGPRRARGPAGWRKLAPDGRQRRAWQPGGWCEAESAWAGGRARERR